MSTLTRNELLTFIKVAEKPSLSIYMPCHKTGEDFRQNQIRFKNLLREAEIQLMQQGYRSGINELLGPAYRLGDDPYYWHKAEAGVAMFRSPGLFRFYHLPLNFDEQVIVAGHFYIKPLLPMFTGQGRIYLLALSHHDVRLFESTHYRINQIALPEGIPENIAEFLKYDEPEKRLESHPELAVSMAARPTAVFYRQEAIAGISSENLHFYCYLIDKGLQVKIGQEKVPLLLAGEESLQDIYREENTYPQLMKEGIAGNPDYENTATLRRQGWEVVRRHFAGETQAALQTYRLMDGTGLTTSDFAGVLTAAFQGRIATLFISPGVRQWGIYDPNDGTITLHDRALAGDEELVNLAAGETMLNGGIVYTIPPEKMPGKGPVAAIFHH